MIRTWMLELCLVGLVLGAVVLDTGGAPIEFLGAGAVLLSFAHAQVADRLAEMEHRREVAQVSCHRWARRYLVAKELLWVGYFAARGSWSALAGCGLFLAYPVWRAWYRGRRAALSRRRGAAS